MSKKQIAACAALALGLGLVGCKGKEKAEEVKKVEPAPVVEQKPEPVKVNVVAISDARCKECEPVDRIITNLQQVFPALNSRTLDWADAEAKSICEEAGVKFLPAVLFDDSVQKDQAGFARMQRWLVPSGKYFSLRVRAEFDPKAEVCDNGTDDTNDGKTDCEDTDCAAALVCRPEKKGTLEAFVMSQCPYGVMGLNAMKEVLDAFGKEMTFNIHYIADQTGEEIVSMHGPAEVEENVRELCAIAHYGKNNKYMEYILCRNKDIRSADWKQCTGTNGIDAATMEKCATGGEGKTLLSEDLKLAKELKIGASPTWLVNNKRTFNGVAADAIQKQFCTDNPDLKGCSAKLSGADAAQPQGNCGN